MGCCSQKLTPLKPLTPLPLTQQMMQQNIEQSRKSIIEIQQETQILENKMKLEYSDFANHLIKIRQFPLDIRLYYYFTQSELETYLQISDQTHQQKIQEILRLYNQIEKAILNSDFINFPALSNDNLDHQYLALQHLESLIQKSSIRKVQMKEFKEQLKNIYHKINLKQPNQFFFNQLQDAQIIQIKEFFIERRFQKEKNEIIKQQAMSYHNY